MRLIFLLLCGIASANGMYNAENYFSIRHHMECYYTDYTPYTDYTAEFDAAILAEYTRAFAATDIAVGVVGKVNNTGNALTGSGGHLVGTLGWVTDTSTGQLGLIGAEGKVEAGGAAGNHNGLLGQVIWTKEGTNSLNSRTLAGSTTITKAFAADGTTPLAEGTLIGYYAHEVIGGQFPFSFMGFDPLSISPSEAEIAKNIQISHDGTDGKITTSSGDLVITAAGGDVNLGDENLVTTGNVKAATFSSGAANGISGTFPVDNDGTVGELTSITVTNGIITATTVVE